MLGGDDTKKINMIGQKFGRLTVIEECKERDKHRHILFKCVCDCGNYVNVLGTELRNGRTKSCGCLQKEKAKEANTKHGKRNTRLYRIYYAMINRCYRINNANYINYGGRGIVVCDEWKHNFEAFYNWAINNYKEGLTIDRIDHDGNYEPDNCKWITYKEQNNNKRNNIKITYNGKTQTLKQWADELRVNYSTLKSRHRNKWSVKDILFGRSSAKTSKIEGDQL